MYFINLRPFKVPPTCFKSGGSCFAANFATAAADDENIPANVPKPVLSSTNVAQFRAGTGGRASFSGNVVTVFGLTGFTGLRVVNRLAKHGNQMILPYRCDPYYLKEHKVVCELGQVLFFPYQPRDEDSIRKAVKHSNTVISLIGANLDTPNFTMYDSNVEVPQRIARICREMGVQRLVHVSAMSANPEHKSRYIKNGSFLKTKGLGEQAVRAEFPSATIVRPAILFGEYDQFIFHVLSRFRKNFLDWVYIYKGGKGIYKMPLFVDDFSNGLVKAALDPIAAGKTYEFVGPHCYEMCELVDFICGKAGLHPDYGFNYRRTGFPEPQFLAGSFLCWLYRKIWRKNKAPINWEWLDFVEATSDVLSDGGTLMLKDLGLTNLHEFENKGAWLCHQYSYLNTIGVGIDDYPSTALPLRSPPLHKHKVERISVADVRTEKRAFGIERKLA